MENQLNQKADSNLIDFQTSLTHYIVAIETLMKAVDKKENNSSHPSLASSKPILAEILDQTLQLKKRRLQLITHDQKFSIIPESKALNYQNWTIAKPWVIPTPPYK